ncbi:hypothetical protein HY065_03420, partial [Candidatus Berkelbacteria bacterium]|nr:hypothetical protein [Candidatus Berkelbacteria bacterium]
TGHVVKIVEEKNATALQKKQFKWKNAGPWLVKNKFLWQALPRIKKNKRSGEYYLTDLLELAVQAGHRAIAVPVAHVSEATGVNTIEHLKDAQTIYEKSLNSGRHSAPGKRQ